METVKLATALLRRKELQQKLMILTPFKQEKFFEMRAQRVRVTENLDDVTAQVPKLTLAQFTAEYDWHARQLRLIDAAIQNANWTTEIHLDDSIMKDYVEKVK